MPEAVEWFAQAPRRYRLWPTVILLLALVVLSLAFHALYPASAFHEPLWLVLAWACGVVPLVALHEGCHFVALRIKGASPRVHVSFNPLRFGVDPGGWRARRRSWIVVALAPAIVTVPLTVALAIADRHTDLPAFLVLAAIAGSAADFSLVRRLLRYAGPEDLVDDSDPRPGFHVVHRVATD